jgi:hypothetical protein
MSQTSWPDVLQLPDIARVQTLLDDFWQELARLADLLSRDELLLAAECVAHLRRLVLEMMLALNGIAYPAGTAHLNGYLGASQRTALERTLRAPSGSSDDWIGQAVALTVIYRWYAPQLVARYGLIYPQDAETHALAHLVDGLPDWPEFIATD